METEGYQLSTYLIIRASKKSSGSGILHFNCMSYFEENNSL